MKYSHCFLFIKALAQLQLAELEKKAALQNLSFASTDPQKYK